MLPVLNLPHSNSPVAYAFVYFREGLSSREAVMAFGYNRLAGMVSAALRLISIGQQEGQTLLTNADTTFAFCRRSIEQKLPSPCALSARSWIFSR
jgi:urease accessory protein UreF